MCLLYFLPPSHHAITNQKSASWNNTIFEHGGEKWSLKFLRAGDYFCLLHKSVADSVTKITIIPHGGTSK